MQIVVFQASALHLGFLGCYGNDWVATPNLDRLAAEGVVFDQHYADDLGQGCGAVVRNLLQELEATKCCTLARVTASNDRLRTQNTERLLAKLASPGNRKKNLCWIDLPNLYPPWTVDDGFSQSYLANVSEDAEEDNPAPLKNPTIGPFDRGDMVLWDRLRGTYAALVTSLDAAVGAVLEHLRQAGLLEELAILFTADRGLALGDHGIVGDCKPWLHDEAVHLPLIIRLPGGAEAGRRIFALTQPADLAATLLDLFAQSARTGEGRSLLPLMRGEKASLRDFCFSCWQLGDEEEWALRAQDCALVVPIKQSNELPPRPVQYYVKPEDRWEVNNVVQHHLELAEKLEQILRDHFAAKQN